MDSDIAQLLRPARPDPDPGLDLQDVQRRVQRRRRTRAAATVAVAVIAVPLALQQLPAPIPDVVFSPSGETAVGDAGNAPQGQLDEADTTIQSVLATADVAFAQARPPRTGVSRDEATEVAARHLRAPAKDADAAVYGSATEAGRASQEVWAIRFDQSGEAGDGAETTVVLVDATQGDVVFSASASRGHGQEGVTMSVPLGSGSTGGSAPAQRARYTGRGSTPRAAAMASAAAIGRRGLRVQSVVYIAETSTRILIHDTTGCWVYSADTSDGGATWRAAGGTVPCDP